ncbi:hypothetical protein [Streptomyces sp. NPDC029674]|uniref:hypothetical protein n=1 Tax=Streptomyces sp. NPDC029674 TaxID=3365297 RepID=UPI00384EA978
MAAWLFPTGVTCHVLLAAALRNPTVRLRYPAACEALATDAPHLQESLAPPFRAAFADLRISSTDDLLRRAGEVTRFLPRLWQTTEDVLTRTLRSPHSECGTHLQ